MSPFKIDLAPLPPAVLKVGEEDLLFRQISLSDEAWFVGIQKDKKTLEELQIAQVALALHQMDEASRELFDRLTELNTRDLTKQGQWDEAAKLVCDNLQRPQMQPLMETVVILHSNAMPDEKETGEETAEGKKFPPIWMTISVSFLAGWAGCLALMPFLD